MPKGARRLVRAATLALALAGCGGGGKREGPTIPPPPEPTPAPGPPAYVPVSASCERLPLGSPQYTCRDDAPSFYQEVIDAIDTLKIEHPEYFQGNTILNGGGYYVGLIQILDRQGLCAYFDGHELAVKKTNEWSEQYRLQTSWREIRRAYMGACYPAWFPVAERAPAPSPPGCRLPPSLEVACDRIETPQFTQQVEAAVDQVIGQRPELFDFARTAPGSDWPLLRDPAAYHAALVEVLAALRFCAKFDGEEVQLKQSNEWSEHYDLIYADRYVRRGPGAYRSSCYPAAF